MNVSEPAPAKGETGTSFFRFGLILRRLNVPPSLAASSNSISTIQQEVAERERLRDERRRTKRLLKEQQTLQEQGAEWSSLFGPRWVAMRAGGWLAVAL